MDFSFLLRYQADLLQATLQTLELSFATILVGTCAALVALPLRLAHGRWARWTGWMVLNPFRILPALVLLVWGFYGLPILLGVRFSAWTIAVLGLGLNMAGFCVEIFRSAVEEVPADQVEAAQLLGMGRADITRHVLFPLAFRNA